jgi:hypothetical protein
VDIAKAQHWRLELPAAAVGEIGAYRFEIPRAMLATAKRGPRPGGD